MLLSLGSKIPAAAEIVLNGSMTVAVVFLILCAGCLLTLLGFDRMLRGERLTAWLMKGFERTGSMPPPM